MGASSNNSSKDLLQLAQNTGHKKTLNKGERLTPYNADCDPIGFVVLSGICRVVFPLKDGTEITKTFLRPGDFGLTPYLAIISAANSYVDCVTKSELLVAPWSSIETEIKSSPELRRAVEAELTTHTSWKAERWIEDRTLSSTERYLKLQCNLGDDFNSVPLHMIASYIGISPVQLSRLRRQFK